MIPALHLLLLLLSLLAGACSTRVPAAVPPPSTVVVADSVHVLDEVSVLPRLLNRSEVNREVSERFERLPPESRIAAVIRHRLLIDEDGAVGEIRLVQSSGRADLDQAVAEALALARFSPGSTGGRPAQVWTEHSIHIEVRVIWM